MRSPTRVPDLIWVALPILTLAFMGLASGQDTEAPGQTKAEVAPETAGADLCKACHADVAPQQEKDWHGRLIASRPGSLNCEDCHGPSAAHAADPGNTRTFHDVTHAPAGRSGQACLSCHQQPGRNAALWRASEHAQADVRCWDCHSHGSTPHETTIRRPSKEVCYACHQEQQATFELTSHHPVREGRVDCSDCHDAHARQSDSDWPEKCASCHAEQRGPFVFAHEATSGDLGDGCRDCHRAHGSPNERLLKYAGRGLCLQCHADHALHFISRDCWDSGCHTDVHGSSTDPLFLGP